MIDVAVLGYGTIGSGVVEIIEKNNTTVSENAMDKLRVKYVLDLREFDKDPVQKILVHDFTVILSDPEVKIIVETMGGLHPAYEYSKQALQAGKNVCTSNKDVVALYGHELMEIAKSRNVNYMFEASCGGGIPIIRAIYNSFTGDVIEEITGIMNGTTNYILSRMETEGYTFDEALKQAQDLGYAERDPKADIEGYDPCRKIAILSSIAYDGQIDYTDIYTEGITGITATDFVYAKEMGMRIKLFGASRKTKRGITAIVAPYMVDSSNPLYCVNEVFNAIFIKGNMIGNAMFYGSGAGKLPTASAVVGDIVDISRHMNETVNRIFNGKKIELIPHILDENGFFVRVKGMLPDLKPQIQELFGDVNYIEPYGLYGEFAFVIPAISEGEFKNKAKKLPGMITRIRTMF